MHASMHACMHTFENPRMVQYIVVPGWRGQTMSMCAYVCIYTHMYMCIHASIRFVLSVLCITKVFLAAVMCSCAMIRGVLLLLQRLQQAPQPEHLHMQPRLCILQGGSAFGANIAYMDVTKYLEASTCNL
jgi:hypothetical protein